MPATQPALESEIYQLHAQICRALSDPKRLLIINELRTGEKSVGELASSLGLAQANVSQHLSVLRDKRLVTTRRDGTTIYYSLSDAKIIEAFDLLREVMSDLLTRELSRSEALARSLTLSRGA